MFNNFYSGRRVLVTGNTGFKGSWLTAWLVKLGAQVCGFSIDLPTTPSLFGEARLETVMDHRFGDVRDLAALRATVEDFRPDIIFHLAAQAIVSRSYTEPLETLSTNIMGVASILEVLRGVEWECACVVITSDKCYHNVEWPWGYRENDRLGGKDVYSGSKAAAEIVFHSYLSSFFADSPVRLATARAGNVIGGGDWAQDRIVVDCIRAWSEGRSVTIRSPAATRPWQHVLEPLSGYLHLGQRLAGGDGLHGESFNFGPRAEQNATVIELMTAMATRWGLREGQPAYEIIDNIPFNEAGLLKLSCDKALMDLGWDANLLYAECVEFTADWYVSVVKDGKDAREVTDWQINAYERHGLNRNRSWAG